ncbi:hypothetical protein BDW68DRAFT_22664 [Aspergillus falconensis]
MKKALKNNYVVTSNWSISVRFWQMLAIYSSSCHQNEQCRGMIIQKEGNGNIHMVLRIQNRSVSLHPKIFHHLIMICEREGRATKTTTGDR